MDLHLIAHEKNQKNECLEEQKIHSSLEQDCYEDLKNNC